MRRISALLAVLVPLAAASAAPAADGVESRISGAFAKLGMAPERSACYGRIIAGRLDGAQGEKAARILEAAKTGGEVRKAVNAEGGALRLAFFMAWMNCG